MNNLKTLEDVNAVILNIAVLNSQIEKHEAAMNENLLKVKQLYEPRINERKKKVEEYEKQLAAFGKVNRKLFKEERSKKLTYGTVGYNYSKPALKLLNKNWTWDRVKEKIQDLFSTRYVKVETTIIKNKMLSDADAGILSQDKLETCGVKVTRSESFFYKINWDEIRIENLDK